MNLKPVWEIGITGKGSVVSILDDGMYVTIVIIMIIDHTHLIGIEHSHPDLEANYVSQQISIVIVIVIVVIVIVVVYLRTLMLVMISIVMTMILSHVMIRPMRINMGLDVPGKCPL